MPALAFDFTGDPQKRTSSLAHHLHTLAFGYYFLNPRATAVVQTLRPQLLPINRRRLQLGVGNYSLRGRKNLLGWKPVQQQQPRIRRQPLFLVLSPRCFALSPKARRVQVRISGGQHPEATCRAIPDFEGLTQYLRSQAQIPRSLIDRSGQFIALFKKRVWILRPIPKAGVC